ncbi:hypothetical protein AGMMS49942_23310 [Spirochaetia bacterium]|nr:hypothetical protein AGMMS49942_23310 [Spirochaetia bacterium]
MNVQGRDCTITLKTQYREMGLPYAEETIREAVSLLKENPAIEGDGNCGAIRNSAGVTGCVVTPLSIETVPLLFVLALGRSGVPVFISETKGLYRHTVNLSAMESGLRFDLIQERGTVRTLYEGCRVKGFELRIIRGEAIKLKLDITGDQAPVTYAYPDSTAVCGGELAFFERFKENGVKYRINGKEQTNIYGLTIATRKQGGTQTEVWIHRVLESTGELPQLIESLEVTAQLYRDSYEYRSYGAFRLRLSRLVLMADETDINSGDTVIGPLRFYCAGLFSADVFTADEEVIE